MSDKIFKIWMLGFLLSISWYATNLGLMELLRTNTNGLMVLFWMLLILSSWIVGWHPKIRNLITKNVKNRKQAKGFVLRTMGILLLVSFYELYFVVKESLVPLAQGGFYIWRRFMSYTGLMLVLLFITVDLIAIKKEAR